MEKTNGVNIIDLDLWVQIDSVKKKKQSSATLWVRDTCLIAGLLPLMIILITASLSSKCRASHQIKKTSRSTKRNQHHSIQDCCAWLELRFGFGCACLMWCYATSLLVLDLWFSVIGVVKSERLLLPIPNRA